MKKLSFLLFAICFVFASCNNEESTMEEDYAKLDNMREDIIKFSQAKTQPCTNSQDWGFIKLDASSCSENGGYILYYKKINVTTLQKKIENYNKTIGDIYEKWGIYNSLCAISIQPTGVKCVNNKPEFSFEPIASKY